MLLFYSFYNVFFFPQIIGAFGVSVGFRIDARSRLRFFSLHCLEGLALGGHHDSSGNGHARWRVGGFEFRGGRGLGGLGHHVRVGRGRLGIPVGLSILLEGGDRGWPRALGSGGAAVHHGLRGGSTRA